MPFEDELGEALRRTGDGFTADRTALVDAGERRGRRLVARRRAAVVGGSVLALAAIGTAGAYTGGLFGAGSGSDGSGSGPANVAAPPALPTGSPGQARERAGTERAGTGAVSAEQMINVLKELLPAGQLTGTQARGTGDETGPMVSGVFDDGKGKGSIGLSLSRVDAKGAMAADMVKCPDRNLLEYDGCSSDTLADGSKLLLFQGYEYADRRVDTKNWRATLVTPQGFLVDVQEYNAAAEKGKPITRPTPPLTLAQLQALAVSPLWHLALNDLPAAGPEKAPPPPASSVSAPDRLVALSQKYGVPVVDKGGEGDYGYVVLDEGKGRSLVQVNVQSHMGDAAFRATFTGPDTTTLPDGTLVKTEDKPGEKGGANVVWWSVDTLRPDGKRVVVSGFNTGKQTSPATRDKPALTQLQLREIALDPKWFG
ncbi:hypothetical protein ACFWBF_04310 [Streptomyces sp. NPDC060028]|uniref:hypothetical protein n=1 Tax=Streptomyces sp. NPDC060028 TaxID=3347041 RepID=UPI00369A3468